MVLLGIWADLGALLLVLFLVGSAVLMHGFWKETEPGPRREVALKFRMNILLAGASLMLVAFFAYAGDDLGLTITGPLFSLR